eukprot:TRINITY_DN4557_c0_g1_i2.p1 TRINITY_DN4557_c0_g1~~TRINITY_DN4557_c0_g1_i2.p1  ORF type:complete len:287 (-),score=31.27 TRINITY_DN4557_c0_g1_i2:73-933(-)
MKSLKAVCQFAGACSVAVVAFNVACPCRITGSSMQPTIAPLDWALVEYWPYTQLPRWRAAARSLLLLPTACCPDRPPPPADAADAAPFFGRRGDVVVVRSPKEREALVVKRVVAVAGDAVHPRGSADDTDSGGWLTVPAGHVWLEGDNAATSIDSNHYGPVPLGLIEGRALGIVWPPSHWRRLDGSCAYVARHRVAPAAASAVRSQQPTGADPLALAATLPPPPSVPHAASASTSSSSHVRPLRASHTVSHYLSNTLSHTLTHTHTHSLSHTLARTHARTHSLLAP